MTQALKIQSFNVNGISDNVKRKAIFRKLKRNSAFCLLQETHSTVNDERLWQSEWGNKILFSHGASNSRGVAILFPSFDWELLDTSSDSAGRYLMIRVRVEDIEYVIINIYAPTRDNRKEQLNYISYVRNQLLQYNDGNIIIAGDFNFYMNI